MKAVGPYRGLEYWHVLTESAHIPFSGKECYVVRIGYTVLLSQSWLKNVSEWFRQHWSLYGIHRQIWLLNGNSEQNYWRGKVLDVSGRNFMPLTVKWNEAETRSSIIYMKQLTLFICLARGWSLWKPFSTSCSDWLTRANFQKTISAFAYYFICNLLCKWAELKLLCSISRLFHFSFISFRMCGWPELIMADVVLNSRLRFSFTDQSVLF